MPFWISLSKVSPSQLSVALASHILRKSGMCQCSGSGSKWTICLSCLPKSCTEQKFNCVCLLCVTRAHDSFSYDKIKLKNKYILKKAYYCQLHKHICSSTASARASELGCASVLQWGNFLKVIPAWTGCFFLELIVYEQWIQIKHGRKCSGFPSH